VYKHTVATPYAKAQYLFCFTISFTMTLSVHFYESTRW